MVLLLRVLIVWYQPHEYWSVCRTELPRFRAVVASARMHVLSQLFVLPCCNDTTSHSDLTNDWIRLAPTEGRMFEPSSLRRVVHGT
jgi:hypothetical protein